MRPTFRPGHEYRDLAMLCMLILIVWIGGIVISRERDRLHPGVTPFGPLPDTPSERMSTEGWSRYIWDNVDNKMLVPHAPDDAWEFCFQPRFCDYLPAERDW